MVPRDVTAHILALPNLKESFDVSLEKIWKETLTTIDGFEIPIADSPAPSCLVRGLNHDLSYRQSIVSLLCFLEA